MVINHHFGHVHPVSGLEQNSVLFGAGIWYQTNPVVPDLHDTRTRNWHLKHGVNLWHRFLERVSWVLGLGPVTRHVAKNK